MGMSVLSATTYDSQASPLFYLSEAYAKCGHSFLLVYNNPSIRLLPIVITKKSLFYSKTMPQIGIN